MIQHQILNQPQSLKQQLPPQIPSRPPPKRVSHLNQQQQMMSHMNQAQMVSQGQNYGSWTQPPSNMPPPMNTLSSFKFANPISKVYGTTKHARNNWKGKNPMDKRKDGRRMDMVMTNSATGVVVGPGGGGLGYKPPTLQELERQNRLKARRFYPKKKYNRMAPYAHAPRNTTSFIIRAKKAGGIASLVSPYPATPAVLPTPVLSPSREALVEMAKEEWGVDGYGSMKGLIRLRSSPGHETEVGDYEEEDEEDEGGSSGSDIEEHMEVERRLDHDLSRFEMIYPDPPGAEHNNNNNNNSMLENPEDDQDTHIAQLEEENLLLKDRLYLMERELGDLRRRLQFLERRNQQVVEVINDEEIVENPSEDDKSDEEAFNEAVSSVGENKQDIVVVANEGFMVVDVGSKEGTLDTKQAANTQHVNEFVLKDSGIQWNEKEDLKTGSTSTGMKVEQEEEQVVNAGETLIHEPAGA
ncbi:hypothetical protein Dimus_011670 [Dionaea muscipula]